MAIPKTKNGISAFDQVAELYRRYPQPRSFAEDVELHAWHGVAIVLPHFIMLARPVDIHDPEERWRDPAHRYNILWCDCWFIHTYCGISQNNPCNYAPMELPWIAWSRRDRPPRIYPTAKLQRKCEFLIPSKTRSSH